MKPLPPINKCINRLHSRIDIHHDAARFLFKTRFVDATGSPAPVIRADLFILVDEKIQITPDNTRHLYSVLKERVTKIVEEVA